MTQYQLDQEVAHATGERLSEIRRRGFRLANPEDVGFDPEPACLRPQIVDWDQTDAERLSVFP